eukprot:CAMPEP_0119396938 /NCGR_PEP_ID=MMETSP1334-20130426/138995_1 /TAXON_ID=127549 /ORGANISM="Calcidiscus leptoporus, Strain RCC1130" /LENGTH=141 /DNA_ID=CAMNT_0007420705 /DNA_START=143 /DNA_END=565 /DNA_ORIENTATION=+
MGLPLVPDLVTVDMAARVHLQAVRKFVDDRPLALRGADAESEVAVMQLALGVSRATKRRLILHVRALTCPARLGVRLRADIDVELPLRRDRRPAVGRVRRDEEVRRFLNAQHSECGLEPSEHSLCRPHDAVVIGAIGLEMH